MSALRVIIHGRVQGVSYRAWTAKTAVALGVHGWVRNLKDGTVEAVFSADDERIKQMIEACKKGPMMARVEKIEQFSYSDPVQVGFMTLPTT